MSTHPSDPRSVRSVRGLGLLALGAGILLAGCSLNTRPETEFSDTIRLIREERLVSMLGSSYWKVRRDAARELAHRGREAESLPAVRRAIVDCRAEVRVWALAAVWRLSGRKHEAPAGIVDALSSCEYEVRLEAAEAARLLGPSASNAVHALTHLTRDGHHPMRRAACLALGSIGPDARESIPHLAALLSDPFPEVVYAAMHALGEIGDAGSKAALTRVSRQEPEWRAEQSRRVLPTGEAPSR